MDWLQVCALVLGNAAFIIPMFLWNRAESRADYRHMETGVNAQLQGIREEIKDFHKRLCEIEARRSK